MLRRAAILLLLALAVPCAAQPRFGLSADAFAVYQRWVLAMCLGTDEREMRTELLRHAAELAPAFRRAISEGPTAAEAQQVRAAAQALFDQRRNSPMNELEITGVTRADLARFQRQTRESFAADQVRRFVTGYRANAVAALGIVADAPSRALLSRIAANERDPLAPAAREALKVRRTPP